MPFRASLLTWLLLLPPPCALAATDVAQSLHRSARTSVAESRFDDVLRLWLLNNSFEQANRSPNRARPELLTALWIALGKTGHCPAGLSPDPHGLWTIAAHNAVLQLMHPKPAPEPPAPFDGFALREQHRFVDLGDVLSAQELLSLKIHRPSPCREWRRLAGEGPLGLATTPLSDRIHAARALRGLLRKARSGLRNVEGPSLVEARIFDLNLFLAQSKEAGDDREVAAILEHAGHWTAEDWLRLSPERREYLFAHLPDRRNLQDEALPLAIADGLALEKKGSEVMRWIGFWKAENDAARRRLVFEGPRGERLLSLDAQTGFTARAAIALHRGVAYLEQGDVHESLRAFAWALRYSSESEGREAPLARRWIAFIAGSYETSPALLATLREILPREESAPVYEELAWRAAFRADAASFANVVGEVHAAQALLGRVERLRPLARGAVGEFSSALMRYFDDEPYASARFLKAFLDHLEAEDTSIRARFEPLLGTLETKLEASGRQGRTARSTAELLARIAALRRAFERSQALGVSEKARRFAPGASVFAGNLRVAPPDVLPWPFEEPETRPPAVFVPIQVLPHGDDAWRLAE